MNEIQLGLLNVFISACAGHILAVYPMWNTLGWKKRGTVMYISALTLFIIACYLFFVLALGITVDAQGIQLIILAVSLPAIGAAIILFRRQPWQIIFLIALGFMYGPIHTGIGMYITEKYFAGTDDLLIQNIIIFIIAVLTLPPLLILFRRICNNPHMKQAVVFWRFIWLMPVCFFIVATASNSYLYDSEKDTSFIVIRIVLYFAMLLSWYLIESSVKQIANAEMTKHKAEQLAADNAALENLNRMKTMLLQDISHEIKTPLTIISGNVQQAAEIFESKGTADRIITESLQTAHEESLRLGRLTENALRMAVMQESRDKMKPLDPAAMLSMNAEGYRRYIKNQRNVLTINTANDLPLIFGNADQLIQVLMNLLANANKHTKNGEITVSAHLIKDDVSNEDYIAVTVADTGTGIAPELLPHVFGRSVTGSDGTGMGLAICKKIIETHGGTIEIESITGEGTTVMISLPVYMEEKAGDENG